MGIKQFSSIIDILKLLVAALLLKLREFLDDLCIVSIVDA